MSVEITTEKPRTDPALNRGREIHFDWNQLHRRLEASDTALQRRLTPSAEERQKILHARARLLAGSGKAEAKSPRQSLEVVEFILGPEHYGLESSYIREIHPLTEFTPLPCTPAFVLGLVNVRGQILSIIDIKKLFDLPAKGLTDLNKVIVVHADHMELGILADVILGVRSITLEELQPALPTLTGIREEYLKGITRDPMVVLDAAKILADEKILVNDEVDTTI
jgi:purine-binding chemotaxis protein CheW